MEKELTELEELTREITRVIADNRKFLDRVMDDDFEPDVDEEEADEVEVEL